MKKIAVATTLMVLSSITFAMQDMDDQALAQQTGQEGLTIGVSASTVKFDQISVIDTDGIAGSATHNKEGALVIAPSSNSDKVQVQLLNDTGSPTATTLLATIDSDAGTTAGSGAFVNMGLAFPDLKKIDISPLSIYLAKPSGTVGQIGATGSIFDASTALRPDVTRVLSLDSGMQINFVTGKPLAINVQLGSAPQGHMLAFSGSLDSVNIPKIQLYSKGTNTSSSLQVNSLQLKSNIANGSNGFSLAGFYAGIESDRLVAGNVGTTDKFDLTVSGVIAGAAGAQDPATFGGLKNSSLGSFGVVGASVTNLKINVRGL